MLILSSSWAVSVFPSACGHAPFIRKLLLAATFLILTSGPICHGSRTWRLQKPADRFNSFKKTHSSENRLRHYTPELGCIDPSQVPTIETREPCWEAFKDHVEFTQFCSDPYIGGDPKCCFDPLKNNCTACYGLDTCDHAHLKCAADHLHNCGAHSSQNISDMEVNITASFLERRGACVFGTVTAEVEGYWRHPGYVLLGSTQHVDLIQRVQSTAECAAECDAQRAACDAFTYTPQDKVCRLQEGAITGVCALGEPGCVDPGVETYYRDAEHMYCGTHAMECACHREYFYCMQSFGCVDEEEVVEYSALCAASGCTSNQCGLEKATCNATQAICVNDYFSCSYQFQTARGGQCPCTKQFMHCMSEGGCEVTSERDALSGFTVHDLCEAEGCTAAECGLGEAVCNASLLHCAHDFLGCASGAQGEVFWDRNRVGGYQAGSPTVSEHAISWPPLPSGVYAGAMATRGVYAGKYYWEVRVSGPCALVGVALESFDHRRYPGFDQRGWSYGDLGFGGERFNDRGSAYGPAISSEAVISVALDARQGSLWFAKDGVWMSGNPALGTSPAFVIQYVGSLFPAVGASPGCGGNVSIAANFGHDDFLYPVPTGFVQLRSDECLCTGSFMHCMQSSGCDSDEDRKQLLDSCYARGCDPAVCGLPEFIATPWLCEADVPVSCNQEYIACSQTRSDECECTQQKFQCMATNGCQLDPAGLTEYAQMCATRGCTAEQCGLCEPTCNVTSLQCSQRFMECTIRADIARNISETDGHQATNETVETVASSLYAGMESRTDANLYCGCAAEFYECMDSGNCITDEIAATHAEMCADNGCTAQECGMRIEQQTCNQTNLACSERYVTCMGQRLNPLLDRCTTNYRSGGAEFCSNPLYGGVYGCRYEAATDSCFTSPECACAEEFFVCMRDGCVEDEELQGYMRECTEMGCTAEQCGLTYFTCNQTALLCANDFIRCDLSVLSTDDGAGGTVEVSDFGSELGDLDLASDEESPWCATSFCIRNYFKCMESANCVTEADLRAHLAICEDMGCTLGECGIQVPGEVQRPPDAPVRLRLRSLLGERIIATWANSPLAIAWSRRGSVNAIIQYAVSLHGDCAIVPSGTGFEAVCSRVIANATTVPPQQNLVLFQDLDLAIGTLYQVQVAAVNINGTGPAAVGALVLAGPPKEPVNVNAERLGALAARVSWDKPLDTGDLTPNYPLLNYTVRVLASPIAAPVLVELSAAITTFSVLDGSVGGSWVTCAEEGGACGCVGAARFGASGIWSPPVEVKGQVPCATGSLFPDRLPGIAKTCECNAAAQLLVSGENLSATVSATNDVGQGPFSESAMVRIMGYPSEVQDVTTAEHQSTVDVTWSPPLDRGFGVGDTSVSIVAYTVYLSLCADFNRALAACGVTTFASDAMACGPQNCTLTIPEQGNLVEGSIYWIKVTATNPVGESFLSFATASRLPWKVLPFFTFPSELVDGLPIRLASYDGAVLVWLNGQASASVTARVRHLPIVAVGQELEVPVTTGGQEYTAVATVTDRTLGAPDAYLDDPLGIDVIVTLVIVLPAVASLGPATAVLSSPTRPDKSLSFELSYFAYPAPTLDLVNPTSGSLGGGNEVRFDIVEPTGAETRVAAGIANFLTAPASSLRVVFNTTKEGTQISKTLVGLDRTKIIVTAPPARYPVEGFVPVTFFIDGVLMPLSQPVTYKYRGPYIAAVIPRDGLTTGSQDFQLVVMDVGLISITSVSVSMNGEPCSQVVAGTPTSESTLITGRTPSSNLVAGPVTIVLIIATSAGTITITEQDLYEFVDPPSPLFVDSSLQVPVRPGEFWIANSVATTVKFTVRYLGPQSSIAVRFGAYSATSVSFTTFGPDNDVRLSYTEIEASSPRNSGIPEGFVSITVTAGGLQAQSGQIVEFVDLTQPRIVAFEPSQSRLSGGSVVLVGVTGFCRGSTNNACSPSSFDAQFTVNGVTESASTVYGYTTLQSWSDQDSSYQALRGMSEVNSFFAGIGGAYRAQLESVVSRLQSSVDTANDGTTRTSNSFLILLKTPASQSTTSGGILKITSRTNNNAHQVSTFEYLANPSGAAVVASVVPSQGEMLSSQLVTVQLDNFLMSYFTSEISLLFGSDQVSVARIDATSASGTTISFFHPQSNAGTRTVSVAPTQLPSNAVSFSFTFVDPRVPEVVSFSPNLVYASGGDVVSATLINVGDDSITIADVSIQVLTGTTVTTVTEGASLSYEAVQGRTLISFPAPAGSAGVATVTIQYLVNLESASFQLEFRAEPTGAATLELSPSSGSVSGGFEVLCFLTGLRRVASTSEVVVQFGGTRLGSDAIRSVISSIEETTIFISAPATQVGGVVTVEVWTTFSSTNKGTAQFTYVDTNQALLLYVEPASGDAESATMVNIGLAQLGRAIASASNLDVSVSGIVGATVTVESILGSTLEETNVLLRVPPSPTVVTVATAFQISVKPTGSGATKTVTFTFTYLPPGSAVVSFFSPATYYLDGLVSMTIDVVNFPASTPRVTQDHVMIIFVANQLNATATSITFASADEPRSNVAVTCSIPQGTNVGSVTPRLYAPSVNVDIPFPSAFTYTLAPDVAFRSIFPARGSTVAQVVAAVALDNFPRVADKSAIAIQFGDLEAEVVSFSYADPTLDPNRVQSILVTVNVPCCTDAVNEGLVRLVAFHRSYPLRAAVVSDAYEYIDPTQPSVSEGGVLGENNGPNAKMFSDTVVIVALANVPVSITSVDQLQVTAALQSGTVAVPVELISVQVDGSAQMIIRMPPSSSSGPVTVTITFPSGSTTSFLVVYFDERLPQIASVAPSTGEALGNTLLIVRISNFPLISATSDVTVRFGSQGAYFGQVVDIPSSTELETTIRFLSPPYPLDSGSFTLGVTVTPVAQTNLAVQFEFTYFTVDIQLDSYLPDSGPSTGDTQVFLNLLYFPQDSQPSGVGIEINGVAVDVSRIAVPISTAERTQIVFITPPAAPGVATLRVWSRVRGKSSAITLDFEFFDATEPVLVSPIPSRACIQTSGQSRSIYLENFKPQTTPTVTFTPNSGSAFAFTVSSYTPGTNSSTAALLVTLPNRNSATDGTVLVSSEGREASFPFQFYDCAVTEFVSAVPSKGVTSGGSSVLITIANFAVTGTPTVLFGSASGSVDAVTFSADNSLTFVLVTSPAIEQIGTVTVTVSATSQVTFPFTVVLPCDFEAYCAEEQMIQNPIHISSSPPLDDTCSLEYCIAAAAVPYPVLQIADVSSGETTGGTVVTAQLSNFVALSIDDVQVRVSKGTSEAYGTPQALETSLWTYPPGDQILSNAATLSFAMPAAPVESGVVDVELIVTFASVVRSVVMAFEYFRPVIGAAVVDLVTPTSIFRSQTTEVYVQLSNFPLIEAPLTTTASRNLVKLRAGSVTMSAASIQSSTREQTAAFFTISAATLSTGQTDFAFYYEPFGLDAAGTVQVDVLADPIPEVQFSFPANGFADISHSIQISILYFPTGLAASDITATMVTAGAASTSLTVTALTYVDASCSSRLCSTALVTVTTPSQNPDGTLVGGDASITVCRGLTCSDAATFTYVALNAPFVELVDPATGSGRAGDTTAVEIHLRNFPELSATPTLLGTLELGSISFPGSFSAQGDITVVSAVITSAGTGGTASGLVFRQQDSSNSAAHAAFSFTFLTPDPLFEPVDGTSEGGSLVTITAFWANPGVAADMQVSFGGIAGEVTQILALDSAGGSVTVEARTPPVAAGLITVELSTSSGLSTSFRFEFYDPPVVQDIQPRTSTLDGRVGDCASCIADNDGATVSLWVRNFPAITNPDDLSVLFRSTTDVSQSVACDGAQCQVQTITNMADVLYFTVSVPPWPTAVPVEIIATYTGPAAIPPGLSASGTYVREQKSVSTANLFSYYRPLPVVVTAEWCSECNDGLSCIAAGFCGNGLLPAQGSAGVLTKIPQEGGGVITITVQDMGVIAVGSDGLPASGSLTVVIGDNPATVSRILFSTAMQLAVEVVPSPSADTGVKTSTVSYQPDETIAVFRTAQFSVRVYDPSIVLSCLSGCQGSSAGGEVMEVAITNFRLDATSLEGDTTISFGSVVATTFSLISSNEFESQIRITTPAYDCAACTYVNGKATVSVTVVSNSDAAKGGDTVFTYHRAPLVSSARFSSSGVGLLIQFDSPTDQGDFTSPNFACSSLVAVTGLGTNPTCSWISNQELSLVFGQDPTLVPQDTISILAGAIRDVAKLSPAVNTDPVTVLPPEILLEPGPISIQGPQRVDPCSDLTIIVSVPSPRPLTFTWSCPAYPSLNAFLQTQTGNVLALAEGTPELPDTDATYDLTVYATDFLGAVSSTVVHSVTKTSSAAPSISFVAQPSYLRAENILIRGQAVFSKCPIPQSRLQFSWTQVFGPTDITQYFQDTAQLFIPKNVLNSNSVYTVQVKVTMDGDVSKSTTADHDIVVIGEGLLAIVGGGHEQQVSEQTVLRLSAAGSRDLDLSATEDQGLSYAWTCQYTINGVTYSCRHQNTGAELQFDPAATISLAPYTLAPDVFYVFTVTVSKGSRTSSDFTTVHVVSAPIPTISITGTFTRFDTSGRAKINSHQTVRLQGSSDQSGATLSWSISPSAPWAGLAGDKTVVPFGFDHKFLILRPNPRSGPFFTTGQVYVVSLTGTVGPHSGTARFEFVVNSPPSSGTCEACVVGVSGGTCVTTGRALLDAFEITCSNWGSDELPLSYRYGHLESNSRELFGDYTLSPIRDMYLASGQQTLIARVSDFLGSESETQQMPVTATSISITRRLLFSSFLDEVVVLLGTLNQLGRSDIVNQLVMVASFEMDSTAGHDFKIYKTLLITQTLTGLASAATTTGFAEEVLQSTGVTTAEVCEIETTSVLSSINIANALVDIDTDGIRMSDEMSENLVKIVSSITLASVSSSCAGTAAAPLDPADHRAIMEQTMRVMHHMGVRLLSESFEGEPATEVQESCFKVSAHRNTLGAVGNLSSGGSLGAFQLPPGLELVLGGDNATQYDLISAEQCNTDDHGANFAADFVAEHMQHLSVAQSGSSTEEAVEGLPNPITIRVYFDSQFAAGVSPFWREKATCSFYDPASGQMSFSGCERTGITDTYVECECDHLTGFSSTINSQLPACGDGTIAASEECDDSNMDSGDGCSFSGCSIEAGWFCSDAPSVCCGPCGTAQFRDQCRFEGRDCAGSVCGSCVDCAAGTFKDFVGYYNSSCLDCPTGSYARAGSVSCTPFPTCPAGQVLEGYNLTGNEGSCTPCAVGTYKNNTPNAYDKTCSNLQACAPGSYLAGVTQSEGQTSSGACELCGDGFWKENSGSWYTQCSPCPSNSGSTPGSTAEADCTCNAGWERDAAPGAVDWCVNVDECAVASHNCAADGACTDTSGSFTCACNAGYEGDGVGCDPVCGDGFVYGVEECDDGNAADGDGCAAGCEIESNYECVNGSSTSRSVCACQADYYSPPNVEQKCSKRCSVALDCNSQGACEETYGYCHCNRFWLGVNCEGNFAPFASRSLDIALFNQTYVISLPLGDTITILEGALDTPTTITVDQYFDYDIPASMAPNSTADGIQFAGSILDLKPDGQTFLLPVTLDMVVSGTATDGYDFAVYLFDRVSNRWTQESSSVYDPSTGKVAAQVSHFSTYAVMLFLIPPTTTSSTTPTPTTTAPSTTAAVVDPPPPPPDSTAAPPPPPPDSTAAPPPPPPPPPPPGTTAPPPSPPASTSTPAPSGGGGAPIAAIAGGVVGGLVALAVLAFFLWRRRREPADIVPPPDEPLLSGQGAGEDGVGSFRQPAQVPTELPPTEAPGELDEAEGGWSSCHKCEAPIKLSWPRCPACKAEVDPAALPRRASEEVAAGGRAGSTDPSQAGAAGGLEEGLKACWKCEAPVKSDWPRCPACKAPVLQDGEEPPEDEEHPLQTGEEGAAAGAREAFSGTCASCQAPVKPSWTVCPGCKAPTQQTPAAAGAVASEEAEADMAQLQKEKAEAGFTKECPACAAPVKEGWPRCPGCKTPLP